MARSPSPCRSSPTERPLPSGPPSPTSPAPSHVLDPFGLNQGSPSSPRSPTLRCFDYRLRNPYPHSCPLESHLSSPLFDPRLPLPRRRPAPKPASALRARSDKAQSRSRTPAGQCSESSSGASRGWRREHRSPQRRSPNLPRHRRQWPSRGNKRRRPW